MWQLFIGVILITGFGCMCSAPVAQKPKQTPVHVTITRMTGAIWEVDTDRGVYFEVISDNEEHVKEHTKLTLQNMGYKNLEMKVYV